jgi:hypothetical protein
MYSCAQDYPNPVFRIYCIRYQPHQSDIWPINQDELLRGHSSLVSLPSLSRECILCPEDRVDTRNETNKKLAMNLC